MKFKESKTGKLIKMWADRDMEEHSVFDHKPIENGLNALYAQPHININSHHQQHMSHVPIYAGQTNGGNGVIISGGRILSPVHNGGEGHYSSLRPIDDDVGDNDVEDMTDDGTGSDDTRGLSHQVRLYK